jgi:hypothetical protein
MSFRVEDPGGVENLVATAANKIDSQGELPLQVRNELLGQVLARLPSEQQRVMFIGDLGLSCAERSWPVWLARFADEPEPMNFAQEAVSAASEGVSVAGGDKRLGDLKASLDARFMLGEEFFSAIYAGFSCWAVVADALEKRHEYPSLGGSEQQISPEDWDASFFCITCGRWWRDVGGDR